MSVSSSIKQRTCMEWHTELPYNFEPLKSPVFFVKSSECYFQLIKDASHYYLHLEQKEARKQQHAHAINIKVCATYHNHHSVISYEDESTVEVWKSSTVLWSSKDRSFKTYFEDRQIDGIIFKFFVIFDDVYGSVTMKPETANKSIQADVSLIQADLECLSQDFCQLLDNAVLPNVQLKCDEGIIHAHRAILSARSKVFSTMFQNMKDSDKDIVEIPDVDIETMRMFLKFVYSGKIPDMPVEMTPRLYSLAATYDISSLKKICSDLMIMNLSESNCISCLILSDDHHDDFLKLVALNYITDNVKVMRTEKWKEFSAARRALAFEVFRNYFEKINRDKFFSLFH